MFRRVDIHDFKKSLAAINAGFSYDGANVLFNHLVSIEWGEFDPQEINAKFTEFASWNEFVKDYSDWDSPHELDDGGWLFLPVGNWSLEDYDESDFGNSPDIEAYYSKRFIVDASEL